MSDPLRIAIDARPLGNPTTGIGRYLSALLPYLAQTDHQWFLYSDRRLETFPPGKQFVCRSGAWRFRALSSVFAQIIFPRWADLDEIDVFWSPRHHLPRLRNMACVVTVHDLIWRKQGATMIPLGRLIEQLLMPDALTRATTILTPSVSTATDLIEYRADTREKITITPLAATLAPESVKEGVKTGFKDQPEPPYVLFVGTIEPRKNLHRVIDAFVSLRGPAQAYRLKIAGHRGWKNQSLHKRLSDPALIGRIDFLGEVTDRDLIQLYAGADFLVAPSLYEGFGLQILDALAFSKPVIVSNLSSLPEVAGSAGLTVNPLSVAEIASAMRRLIEDRGLYRKLQSNASAQSARFSWRRTATQTINALELAAVTSRQ